MFMADYFLRVVKKSNVYLFIYFFDVFVFEFHPTTAQLTMMNFVW